MCNPSVTPAFAFLPAALLVAQSFAHGIGSDMKIMRKAPAENTGMGEPGSDLSDVGTGALAEGLVRKVNVHSHYGAATTPYVSGSYKLANSPQLATTMSSCSESKDLPELCQSTGERHQFHCCDTETRALVHFDTFSDDCSAMPSMSYEDSLGYCLHYGKYLCSYLEIESLMQCGAKCGDDTPEARRVWVTSNCTAASQLPADQVVLDASGNEVVVTGFSAATGSSAATGPSAATDSSAASDSRVATNTSAGANSSDASNVTSSEEEPVEDGVGRIQISGVAVAIITLFSLQG